MRIRSLLVPLALASILSAPAVARASGDSLHVVDEASRRSIGSDSTPGRVPHWLRPHDRSDSIWIHTRYTQRDLALPLAEVVRFEVSEEQSPRTWSGARTGFLAGTLLGVAVGANERRGFHRRPRFSPHSKSETFR